MDKTILYTDHEGVHLVAPVPSARGRILVKPTEQETVELEPARIEERDGLMVELQPAKLEIRVKTPAQYREETDEECCQRLALKDVPVRIIEQPAGVAPQMKKSEASSAGLTFEQLPFAVVSVAALPPDRTFRNAWTVVASGAVVVDMDKAREIHRGSIRKARTERFAALDTEYLRADETGNVAEKLAIKLHKQELRDLPEAPEIAKAATTEQLKAAWPSLLSPNPYTTKEQPS